MSQITPRDDSAPAAGWWRGLDELACLPEARAWLEREYPQAMWHQEEEPARREFLRLMAASLALGGVTMTGCRRWPREEVRPHSAQPVGTAPGVPLHYATMFELDGVATGALAKSYDGRPIKIEGNPLHPDSLGASDAWMQASVLELYDPERSRTVLWRDPAARPTADGVAVQAAERTWPEFDRFFQGLSRRLRDQKGKGLAILTQPSGGPTWRRLRDELLAALPEARWFEYQPAARTSDYEGSRLAWGRSLRPQYRLEKARVIVAFDADPFATHPARLRLARDWAAGRRSVDHGSMNRLYVVEPGFTITGSVADLRLPARPSIVGACAGWLAWRLGLIDREPPLPGDAERTFLARMADDLLAARGAGVVMAGPAQSAAVHRIIHAINHHLGNSGATVCYSEEPLADDQPGIGAIDGLSGLLEGNALSTLIVIGGNPVFDGPSDAPLRLASAGERGLTTIHLSLFDNETSHECEWSVPAAHFLECWGDGRGWDGTVTLQQPLIEPLFGGRSPAGLLAALLGREAGGREIVRSTFQMLFPAASEADWERALHDGLVQGSPFPLVDPGEPRVDRGVLFTGQAGRELRLTPDYKVHDGRFANNAWLQELPDPLTKLAWDNAACISPGDAAALQVRQGEIVRLSRPGASATAVEAAVFIMPGQAGGCITLPMGYGRRRGGHIAAGTGFDCGPLRPTDSPWTVAGLLVERTGRRYDLATTQEHHTVPSVADAALRKRLGGKGQPGLLVHETLLPEFQRDPRQAHGDAHPVSPAPLFDPPHPLDRPHKWGLSIDLNACVGCGACVMACQAENNIPVVGKRNVANSREMHWLRVDRYFKGPPEDPDIVHVPMACVHCENAPCEQVCPVAATVHDTEGLNGMVYNRCIGTRYCANNCPYKVRRFNYLDYQSSDPMAPARPWFGIPDQQPGAEISPLRQLLFNPEVTVRMRGVMEKCTYCVQRIAAARISAKNGFAQGERETERVREGEVQTACQQACPTQAITFGDLNDPQSQVAAARSSPRHYQMLEELNLSPRTTWLAKIRNR